MYSLNADFLASLGQKWQFKNLLINLQFIVTLDMPPANTSLPHSKLDQGKDIRTAQKARIE